MPIAIGFAQLCLWGSKVTPDPEKNTAYYGRIGIGGGVKSRMLAF